MGAAGEASELASDLLTAVRAVTAGLRAALTPPAYPGPAVEADPSRSLPLASRWSASLTTRPPLRFVQVVSERERPVVVGHAGGAGRVER